MFTPEQNKMVGAAIIFLLTELNYEPRTYSGRFMFGKECLGVIVESVPTSMREIYANFSILKTQKIYSDEELFLIHEVLNQPYWDNMGKEYIIYWPDLPPPNNLK